MSGSRCFLGRGDPVVQKVAETRGDFVTVGAVPRGSICWADNNALDRYWRYGRTEGRAEEFTGLAAVKPCSKLLHPRLSETGSTPVPTLAAHIGPACDALSEPVVPVVGWVLWGRHCGPPFANRDGSNAVPARGGEQVSKSGVFCASSWCRLV
ncbi:hypothetical protein H257_15685 [Aphanomyces astaci]|uniref:Uncharacterized protein n=1 Tax=Aphanomyces astaci TaxID=112090 RepID=W4FNE0_APHAT|nr:hypothetical protein H257_15685 [Aphanomyces astaci]ETV68364.1 hypothetical protein H257_15685 [Aphanomyces astaci]|eukprot:XP_009842159.1 hypothetical protein H257_15685 [Aphanomyces astaci]